MGNLRQDDWTKEFFGVVIWEGPAGASLSIDVNSEADTTISLTQYDIVEPTMLNWRATVFEGLIEPQPDWEQFDFTFTGLGSAIAVVDSIYVGTQCVPEPSTLVLLLGFGGLCALRYRRRRK